MTGLPYSQQLHNSEGGIRDVPNGGPWTYASEIAKYLPADTARVRTLEMFGHAPPLEYIEGQRAKHQERRESFRQASENLRFVSDGSVGGHRPEAIYGPEFQERGCKMQTGSAALLRAIERARGGAI